MLLTDSLWSTAFSIFLLLFLTILFKAMLFRTLYDSEGLSTPQVLVDWRLWTFDNWFWFIIIGFSVLSITLNMVSRCIQHKCNTWEYEKGKEHQSRVKRASTLDL
ncbi:MAG TPA: hypothetical protein VJ044_11290 [Candidatus Hodarchaeales archaeon]|nr:hypothetical protein [Candidatus Hodarchaeales archaeon]